MRAMQIAHPGGPFELVERPAPSPGPGEVRLVVEACGVCHSDASAKEGHFPGVAYPITPGHEVVGRIDLLGEGVHGWRLGQRVGVGWFGGNCGACEACRRGDLMNCADRQIPGVTRDGGYAEAMVVRASALAAVPDALAAAEAAPLLCAGVTTFNALARCGARAGELVAVQGLGGLGHLAVQFAARLGFDVVAIARGAEKAPLARALGARRYLDAQACDVAAELTRLGGARAILSTVTDAAAMSAMVDGLSAHGRLMVLGAPGAPLTIWPHLLLRGRSLQGSAGGTAIESEDTMAFSVLAGVRPTIETVPLERAGEAYDRMMRGEARFRMVIVTGL